MNHQQGLPLKLQQPWRILSPLAVGDVGDPRPGEQNKGIFLAGRHGFFILGKGRIAMLLQHGGYGFDFSRRRIEAGLAVPSHLSRLIFLELVGALCRNCDPFFLIPSQILAVEAPHAEDFIAGCFHVTVEEDVRVPQTDPYIEGDLPVFLAFARRLYGGATKDPATVIGKRRQSLEVHCRRQDKIHKIVRLRPVEIVHGHRKIKVGEGLLVFMRLGPDHHVEAPSEEGLDFPLFDPLNQIIGLNLEKNFRPGGECFKVQSLGVHRSLLFSHAKGWRAFGPV